MTDVQPIRAHSLINEINIFMTREISVVGGITPNEERAQYKTEQRRRTYCKPQLPPGAL